MKTKFLNTSKLVQSKRKRYDLTQQDLARMIGVHLQVISNIERGIAGIPGARAKSFAKAMNASVKQLATVAAKDFYLAYLSKSKPS